jgi:cell division protease FtsH
MVTEYGMSKLGPLQLETQEGSVFLGRDYNKSRNFSGQVAYEIDQEMREIIDDCYKQATKIIKENRELLDNIANALLENETITKEQIDYIVEHGHMPVDEASDSNNSDSIEELTLSELKELAKEKGIKGYSKMNKEELKEALK